MSDLHTRFRSLDELPTPNLWYEIEKRAMAAQPTPRRLPWVLITVLLLLALAIGGAALIGSGIVTLPKPSPAPSSISGGPSPTPTAVAHRAPTWTAAGNMSEARTGHTATLLADGRVLVAGGMSAGGVLASAELYDPVSGSWRATGNMIQPRTGYTATLLPNGKVLVAGGLGIGDQILVTRHSAELYDPATGSWSATGRMTSSFADHTATLLPNGKVLVAGGGLADLYDVASGRWTATGNMVAQRYYHTATLLPNGKVLVAGGGCCVLNHSFASAELYDPSTGKWSATGSMIASRAYITAALLPNGKVLVSGGLVVRNEVPQPIASAELYDPDSGTWTATGDMHAVRGRLVTYTLLRDGTVLVVGGHRGSAYLASAELYDPVSGTWTATANMEAARAGQSATLLPNGTVLVVGGYIGDSLPTVSASAEVYDPSSGS